MRFRHRFTRWTTIAVVAAGLAVPTALAGCGADKSQAQDEAIAGKIAMLLVRSNANRYIAYDQPHFQQRLQELCPRCEVDVRFAEQDVNVQTQQVKEVLDQGAKVLVLNAVDAKNAGPLAQQARDRGVPVISYDRLVLNGPIDYYVSFDNAKTGQLQGEALLKGVQARGGGEVLWIDGPTTDLNALSFSSGARQVVGDKLPVAARLQLVGSWGIDPVRAWLRQVLPTLKGRNIAGVLSPADSIAGVVVAEMKAAGFPAPVITGQDAEVAGLQRVVSGDQTMTVYKRLPLEAQKAAELAYDLLRGVRQKAPTTVDNKSAQVPAFLLEPMAITKENVKTTVVQEGFVTQLALCTGQYMEACKGIGLG